NWLSPLNFRQTQSEVRGIWREGTGGWVLENETFKQWLRGDLKTLWCPGIPGAGKTVLASYIINHLEKNRDNDATVVYIYCNYKEHSGQTACNLVASLLKQLVQDFPLAFGRISEEFKRHREQDFRPTLSEIRDALINEIKQYSQVFIIVDALDEISEDDDTRSEMLHCLQSLEGSLLVTSRDISSIKVVLHEALRIDICAHEDDVRNYITNRIRLRTQLDRLLGDALREEAIERLIREAQGMFLLSRMHVDLLAHQVTRNDIRLALENLPKEVGGAYDKTMKRIYEGRYGELAKKAITLIINADDLVDKETIMEACAGILIADENTDVCRLVHYSAQEYLVKRGDWAFPDPQAQITNICLDALSVFPPKDVRLIDLYRGQGFIFYARQNWGRHARSIEKTIPMVIREFLSCEANVENALKLIHSRYFKGGSALHLCAYFGLEQTIDYLLGNDAAVCVNPKDNNRDTPLSQAAFQGHVEIVKLLLERDDVDADSKNNGGWVPLLRAAYRGHVEIVKLLLARDRIDVDSKDDHGWTPLMRAAYQGHVDIVKLLLARDEVDADSKDNNALTSLSQAASQGHVEIVKLLLARDEVNVGSKDRNGRTPFWYAIQDGRVEIVSLPLANDGVDVD
ncbi:hypothetical protein SERLA73DRAFT_10382, partial [Serpula lacrymans var. lacrymans S7.3]